jgi:hypothetical protein
MGNARAICLPIFWDQFDTGIDSLLLSKVRFIAEMWRQVGPEKRKEAIPKDGP